MEQEEEDIVSFFIGMMACADSKDGCIEHGIKRRVNWIAALDNITQKCRRDKKYCMIPRIVKDVT